MHDHHTASSTISACPAPFFWVADLRGANLQEANLQEANLEGANLQGAEVTAEQLPGTRSLQGAIMPDGTKHT